jgi:hypothetical protein
MYQQSTVVYLAYNFMFASARPGTVNYFLPTLDLYIIASRPRQLPTVTLYYEPRDAVLIRTLLTL